MPSRQQRGRREATDGDEPSAKAAQEEPNFFSRGEVEKRLFGHNGRTEGGGDECSGADMRVL